MSSSLQPTPASLTSRATWGSAQLVALAAPLIASALEMADTGAVVIRSAGLALIILWLWHAFLHLPSQRTVPLVIP